MNKEIPAAPTNVEDLWRTALADIELQISPANFATWFRHTKILAKQGDTTEIEAYITQAEESIANAQELITQAETQFEAVLVSENPKEIFATVKDLLKQAKDELISAHKLLGQAVEAMKLMHQEQQGATMTETRSAKSAVTTIAPNTGADE